MKKSHFISAGQNCLLLLVLIFLVFAEMSRAQSAAFTFQGKLTDAGNPANGKYDLQFKLYDAVTADNTVSITYFKIYDPDGTGQSLCIAGDYNCELPPGLFRLVVFSFAL